MKRAWASALLAYLGACRGGDASQRPPRAEPSVTSSPAPVGGELTESANARDPLTAGIPALKVVLDDPRLAAARELDGSGDDAAAAREVEKVLAAAELHVDQACAFAYVAGRLHLAAGEATEAAANFDRVVHSLIDAGVACALSPYAALREAEALVRSGRHEEALALARSLPADFAAHDQAVLVAFDALSAKGDRPGALAVARDYLASRPHGVRWGDLSLQVAAALLDGVDGPPEAHAQEALELVTRVLVEAPLTAERGDAEALRARAAAAGHAPASLTVDERARQAQALLDASQPKRALEAAEALVRAIPRADKKHREEVCKAATIAAQASPHGRSEVAAKAWGVAIERCGESDALVAALYNGAKASASAHRKAEAVERFAKVERLFPHHRLADDARFRAAQIALEDGDEAKYESLLASIPESYPDGDMKGEALFRLALFKLGKRELEGARELLDKLLALPAGSDHPWGVAGRAAYFRARVSQLLGRQDDAKDRYAAILGDEPLAYYMLLAYARLRAMDESAAKAALEAASAREPGGAFLTREHAEFASPPFERFARLLEVGEIDAARREAAAGGLTAESVAPEVLWIVGWMYDVAGAPELGHAFARNRLSEYRAHYPAGRWRFAWQVAFPRPWEPLVTRESDASGIPAPLTWAIMREESGFDRGAHSVASAIGLMQLMSSTARLVARGTPLATDDTALERPEVAIALGARLLGSLRVTFAGNPALAIAAYNSGAGAVRRWLTERGSDDFDVFVERIPFDETRGYLKRVLASEAAYASLYTPKAMEELFALPLRASGQEIIASP